MTDFRLLWVTAMRFQFGGFEGGRAAGVPSQRHIAYHDPVPCTACRAEFADGSSQHVIFTTRADI